MILLYEPLYNLSETELSTLRDYLNMNLVTEFICRFISPAEALILFMKKKDDTLCLCVDYWSLNAIMIQDRYLLSLISEILDRLVRVRWFMCLDVIAVYNLLRIKAEQKWMTAFCTRYRNFEYTVMPFELCNAPVTFQSYVNRALRPVMNHTVIAYLNDVLIYSEDFMKHNEHVRVILSLLQDADLYINVFKCLFDVNTVKFLGFIIFTKEIHMNLKRVEMISTWSESQILKNVQLFLEVSNFYQHFIMHYSNHRITNRLNRKKGPSIFSRNWVSIEGLCRLEEGFHETLISETFWSD